MAMRWLFSSFVLGPLPKVDLIGRTVIILDDVCDTGKTLK